MKVKLVLTLVAAITVSSFLVFIVTQFRPPRIAAVKRLEQAQVVVKKSLYLTRSQCDQLGEKLLSNDDLIKAFYDRDKSASRAMLTEIIKKESFPGYVILTDDRGTVFIATDVEIENRPIVANRSQAIRTPLKSKGSYYLGACEFTTNGVRAVGAIRQIRSKNGNLIGLIAVCQPLDSAFLERIASRLDKSIDLSVFTTSSEKISATSLDFKTKGKFLETIDDNTFERAGRLWFRCELWGLPEPSGKPLSYGCVLISTPLAL